MKAHVTLWPSENSFIVCGFPNVKWRKVVALYEGGAQLGQEMAVK